MGEPHDEILNLMIERRSRKNIEKVIQTFQGVMRNAQRGGELYFNPEASDDLPVALPLIGDGYLKMGLENGGTYKPTLYIEIMSSNSRGELELQRGKILYQNIGSNKFEVVSSVDTNKNSFLDALARFNAQKDIDIGQLENPTKDQVFVLQQFSATLTI